jgi:hypothetical protein
MARMTRIAGRMADRDAANRYGLVVALLMLSYLTSVSTDRASGAIVVMLVQLLTLFLTFTVSESPHAQRFAGIACGVLGLMAIASFGFGVAFEFDDSVIKVLAIVSVALYLVAPFLILRHLLRRPVVDARTILGAIAIYLMLGMMFAFSYRAVSLWQPDPAFFGSAGRGDNADYLFFSFITLTTTGYGNLVPATNPGQSIAVLEAIIGQLFLVTALAKIVNAWRIPGIGGAPPGPESQQ